MTAEVCHQVYDHQQVHIVVGCDGWGLVCCGSLWVVEISVEFEQVLQVWLGCPLVQ